MKSKFIATTLSIALAAGCSSIVSKSDYAVAIDSKPSGARFEVTDKAGHLVQSGITPATITLHASHGYFKGETYTVIFKKEGYPDKVFAFSSSVDGWYFGNILFGGLIGMLIVDPVTGAMYKLPDRVDVSLDPEVAVTGPESLTIATIDSLTTEQLARLEKIQ